MSGFGGGPGDRHPDRRELGVRQRAVLRPCGAKGAVRQRRALDSRRDAELPVDRIHCPVGLDLGAETPEEIAVAIVAESLGIPRNAVYRLWLDAVANRPG